MDAIALLLEDHKLLRKLSKEFSETTEEDVEKRRTMLKRIEAELKAQTWRGAMRTSR